MRGTIVTIKWGKRYPAAYVNALYEATRRLGLADWAFVCFTDDSDGFDPGVEVRPLPEIDLPEKYRWTFWRKLSLFSQEANLHGACLYLDLDVVLIRDMTGLLSNWQGNPRFIENWVGGKTKRMARYDRINSSVVLFEGGACGVILERFFADRERILSEYPGDQGFIHDCLEEKAEFFEQGLCVSFKRHCIPSFPLNLILEPKPPEKACVVIFHGRPDPHEAMAGYRTGRMKYRCRPARWIPSIHRPV